MTPSAAKLLRRMRQSKDNWKRTDLDRLYKGFGFVIINGSKHDIIKHPEYPQLRTTLPRHSSLARGYIEFAIKLIDQLIDIQKKEKEHEPDDSK